MHLFRNLTLTSPELRLKKITKFFLLFNHILKIKFLISEIILWVILKYPVLMIKLWNQRLNVCQKTVCVLVTA